MSKVSILDFGEFLGKRTVTRGNGFDEVPAGETGKREHVEERAAGKLRAEGPFRRDDCWIGAE